MKTLLQMSGLHDDRLSPVAAVTTEEEGIGCFARRLRAERSPGVQPSETEANHRAVRGAREMAGVVTVGEQYSVFLVARVALHSFVFMTNAELQLLHSKEKVACFPEKVIDL